MACLNRLGEIVRFKTKFYFIERIFEHDTFPFNVDTEDYTGKERDKLPEVPKSVP